VKTIIIASNNPVKIQAVLGGFARMFPGEDFDVRPVAVPSGVADQPASDRETLQGALNRSENARQTVRSADFWVGIEGGVEEAGPDGLCAFAWVVVRSADQTGKARTGTFFLPPAVSALVRQGKELGEADDIVFGRSNSKQENGAVGLLTGNALDRAAFYEQAVLLALIPFKNESLYMREETHD
jgi:inosine/xanthosine triphosphatase